jgi:hypothetical protein
MRFELFAELAHEKGFFAASFHVKGQPGKGYAQQSTHFSHGHSGPKETEQYSGIDRVPNSAVRPCND